MTLPDLEHCILPRFLTPYPRQNEVLLKVQFAGLNPADRYLAERQYPLKPQLPHILGRDGMGTVLSLGPNVVGIPLGARRIILRSDVGGTRPGTFAEKVVVPVEDLAEVPKGWTDEQASGATLVYLTAFQALTMWGPLPPSRSFWSLAPQVAWVWPVSTSQQPWAILSLASPVVREKPAVAPMRCCRHFQPESPDWRKLLKQQFAPAAPL
jgi:NADPH2:quinone reductase